MMSREHEFLFPGYTESSRWRIFCCCLIVLGKVWCRRLLVAFPFSSLPLCLLFHLLISSRTDVAASSHLAGNAFEVVARAVHEHVATLRRPAALAVFNDVSLFDLLTNGKKMQGWHHRGVFCCWKQPNRNKTHQCNIRRFLHTSAGRLDTENNGIRHSSTHAGLF